LKLILRAIKNCGLEDDDAVDGKKVLIKYPSGISYSIRRHRSSSTVRGDLPQSER